MTVAVPLFLVEFIKQNHRAPRTDELTLQQRRKLRLAARVSEAAGNTHPSIIHWMHQLAGAQLVETPMDPTVIFDHGNSGGYWFWCPGCEMPHAFDSQWSFDGDRRRPTIRPSLLSRQHTGTRCHMFVTNGEIQYLSDCSHELAGKKVPMMRPPWNEETD